MEVARQYDFIFWGEWKGRVVCVEFEGWQGAWNRENERKRAFDALRERFERKAAQKTR